MRLVDLNEGRLELRWTWLPYWIAVGPALKIEIETLLHDAVILNGLPPTVESLESISRFVCQQLARRFAIPGLEAYLSAIAHVQEPEVLQDAGAIAYHEVR